MQGTAPINYPGQGLSVQLKNGWLVVLSGIDAFISPQNGNLRREKLLNVFRREYNLPC